MGQQGDWLEKWVKEEATEEGTEGDTLYHPKGYALRGKGHQCGSQGCPQWSRGGYPSVGEKKGRQGCRIIAQAVKSLCHNHGTCVPSGEREDGGDGDAFRNGEATRKTSEDAVGREKIKISRAKGKEETTREKRCAQHTQECDRHCERRETEKLSRPRCGRSVIH